MNKTFTPAQEQMLEEALAGLSKPQKELPSKYFYDTRGSELFEKITRLDEYYPTRTEMKILDQNLDTIAGKIGKRSALLELGSGSSKKTRMLLEHLDDLVAYFPVDISEEYLHQTAEKLRTEYPAITIKPICADYTQPFSIPSIRKDFDRYLAFYPGSTIGNFRQDRARIFLGQIAGIIGPESKLLIGVDRKKDPAILEAAYNDEKGVTAQFNKNILRRLNRELDADFDLDRFRHKAFYNHREGRVEMHLVSESEQTVHLNRETITFEPGETIHTENSHKYSREDIEQLVGDHYHIEQEWTDKRELFSIYLLQVTG